MKVIEAVVNEQSKQDQLIEFIKKQVDIDLNDYRDETTRSFDKRNFLNVDWKSMSRDTQRKIYQAVNAYGGQKIIMQDSGSWMKSFSLK